MKRQKEELWVKILRIALACVFIFSGIMKAIDPVASGIKIDEYFTSFGMSFMHPTAIYFGVLLNIAEFTLGFMLLFRIRVKLTALFYLLFMTFFFLLTLWLAIAENLEIKHGYDFGIVRDCGCFGQAIEMSNLETFLKNVVLMIPTIIIFAKRKVIPDIRLTILGQWIFAFIGVIIVCVIQYLCYKNLPWKDFSDWTKGTDVTDVYIERPAVQDILFIFKNNTDGTTKTLSETELATIAEQIPDFYTTWEFVDRKDSIIEDAFIPKIAGFNMLDTNSSDHAAEYINNEREMVYILFMHDLDETNLKGIQNETLKKLIDDVTANGGTFVGITNSSQETIANFIKENEINFPIYQNPIHPIKGPFMVRDAVRSNPGLMLIDKGVVIEKWSWYNYPTLQNTQQK